MTGLATADRTTVDRPAVEGTAVWRRVAPFVALTFGLTWLLDLALGLSGGFGKPQMLVVLQAQMLIPAACAISLGFLSTRFGSGRVRESAGRARAFFVFFLAFALAYAAVAGVAMVVPSLAPTMTLVGTALSVVSVIALLSLRLAGGRDSFTRAGLTFGRPVQWLLFGLGMVLFYTVESALNTAFSLGTIPDLATVAAEAGMSVEALMVVGAVGSILVDSFLIVVIAFGEEYGWRGFLQDELTRLGRVRGVLAVGVVWGVWHAPLIAMGYNYPGRPVLGIVLMTAYCVLLAFVLGYVVLKTGSIWLAAFLHALNNSFTSFLASMVYLPSDSAYQFVAGGLYGLALLAAVALLLLRDPIWKATGANAGHPTLTSEAEL